MTSIFPRPGERIIEAPKPGDVISRAGDRRERAARLAARRATKAERDADPERQERDDDRRVREQRSRLEGDRAEAITRLHRLVQLGRSLQAEAAEARHSALHMNDPVEAAGELQRAATAERAYSQVQATRTAAEATVLAAGTAVDEFDARMAVEREARAEALVKFNAGAARRARAEIAAAAAYKAVMEEPDEPAPAPTQKPTKGKRS